MYKLERSELTKRGAFQFPAPDSHQLTGFARTTFSHQLQVLRAIWFTPYVQRHRTARLFGRGSAGRRAAG
jgi:hypothetical protein